MEEYLRSQILSGESKVDTLLPTEEVLCARFGVSRATVRTALGNLQADGLIVRTPAIGSRVIASSKRQSFQAGWNSVEGLLQHTQAVRLHVQSVREIIVDKQISDEIGFAVGRSVVEVEGIRWNKNETAAPIGFVTVYFDSLYNGVLDQIGSDNRPVADLIEDKYHVRIEKIRQEISAGKLSIDAAERLTAIQESPSLDIRRWYSDSSGRMFQMTRTQYPAGRFIYVVEFGRSGN